VPANLFYDLSPGCIEGLHCFLILGAYFNGWLL
ncbi:unnamed protein product, partial [marine sediment metagenome]